MDDDTREGLTVLEGRTIFEWAALADHLQAENEDLRDRLSIYESEAADPATRIPWAEAKAQLGIDGSHPAACGPGCRSQHTDDHSKCPAQCDGDAP